MKKLPIILIILAAIGAAGYFAWQKQASTPNISDPFGGDTSWANPGNNGTTGSLPTPPIGLPTPEAKPVGEVKPTAQVPALPSLNIGDITPNSKKAEATQPSVVTPPVPLPAIDKPKEQNIQSKDIAEIKEQLKALSKVIVNQGDAIKALEVKVTQLRNNVEQVEASKTPAIKRHNVGRLQPLTPLETEEALKLLPHLPQELTPNQYGTTIESCHAALQNGTIDAVIQSFLLLSAQGQKVFLVVGHPAPRNRPIWLEVHNKNSITLLANNLPLGAYQNIQSRAALPQLFQLPAYLITYENNKLIMYKTCEDFKLQTY